MFLNKITLQNFRNHELTTLPLSKNLVILYGANGAGKSNIMESICYLAKGRSYRNGRDAELVKTDATHFSLQATITTLEGEKQFDFAFSLANNEKAFSVNGVRKKRLSEIIGQLRVVIFTPEDLVLIKGSPENKRSFLDFLASQISYPYLYALQMYHKALQQRNELLKTKTTPDDLIPWDLQLATHTQEIVFYRRALTEKLAEKARILHHAISAEKESLGLIYRSFTDARDKTEIANAMISKLKKVRDKDIKHGFTSIGPHRDNLIITINDQDSRIFGSQGQQRTAVLALKLAQMEVMKQEKDEYPLLLLDDIMSELDGNRRNKLLNLVLGKAHTFITSTDKNWIPERLLGQIDLYCVKEGNVYYDEGIK